MTLELLVQSLERNVCTFLAMITKISLYYWTLKRTLLQKFERTDQFDAKNPDTNIVAFHNCKNATVKIIPKNVIGKNFSKLIFTPILASYQRPVVGSK